MFYQIFLLPQVKRSAIIKNKSPCQNFVNTSEKFLKNRK